MSAGDWDHPGARGVPQPPAAPREYVCSIDDNADDDDRVPTRAPAAPIPEDALLLQWLGERDVACPACGYNLRMLRQPRCPECGRGLRLGVHMAQPPLAGWLAVAVPVLLSAGIGALLALLVSVKGPPERYGMFYVGAAFYWASIPAGVLVVVFRRAVMRLSAGAKAAIAAPYCIVAVVAMILMLSRT